MPERRRRATPVRARANFSTLPGHLSHRLAAPVGNVLRTSRTGATTLARLS